MHTSRRLLSALASRAPLSLALLGLLGAFSSCAALDQILAAGVGGVIAPPKVSFQGANLVQAPSKTDLSAYFCPKLLREKAGLGITSDFVCSRLFGAAPAANGMQVGFDLKFQVANPNQIPLPLSEILTALNVFPGQTNQNLGAVCLKMCAPDDAACAGGTNAAGCQPAAGDIKSINDFPRAVANFLVAQGVGAAGGKPVGFTVPKVLAGSSLDLNARLALTPEALLPALEQLARQSIDELKSGKRLDFQIPYNVQGTLFGDAGSLGRVAAPYGPVSGIWPLPAQRLIP